MKFRVRKALWDGQRWYAVVDATGHALAYLPTFAEAKAIAGDHDIRDIVEADRSGAVTRSHIESDKQATRPMVQTWIERRIHAKR